jgi:hypothetical protein
VDPEELFLQVPPNISQVLELTMATFSQSICDLPIENKWDLHINLIREL